MIIYNLDLGKSSVATIEVVCSNNDDMLTMVEDSLELAIKASIIPLTKIRCLIKMSDLCLTELFYQNTFWQKEADLINEINDESLISFVHII